MEPKIKLQESIVCRHFIRIACTFFIVLISACENDLEKVNLVADELSSASESAKEVTILYSDSAKVKVKISALQMDRYMGETPYLEMPKGVEVEFFNSEMQVKTSLTANYAKRFERTGLMEAKSDVVVINEKEEKLNTEHLIWDEANDKIYSDEFVKITTADEIIFGTGFESNMYFTRYKIFNIKGTINLKK